VRNPNRLRARTRCYPDRNFLFFLILAAERFSISTVKLIPKEMTNTTLIVRLDPRYENEQPLEVELKNPYPRVVKRKRGPRLYPKPGRPPKQFSQKKWQLLEALNKLARGRFCWARNATILKKMGQEATDRQVQRWLKSLKDEGYIEIHLRRSCSLYGWWTTVRRIKLTWKAKPKIWHKPDYRPMMAGWPDEEDFKLARTQKYNDFKPSSLPQRFGPRFTSRELAPLLAAHFKKLEQEKAEKEAKALATIHPEDLREEFRPCQWRTLKSSR
jgi:hypothetical protein